jgi:arylsulfatase A-like enzyme
MLIAATTNRNKAAMRSFASLMSSCLKPNPATTMKHLAFLLVLAAGPAAADPQRPNILFIFSDDQSYETLSTLGHTRIDTPNLDRLAARGTTFTHTFNMGAWHGAVCVASRTMLVTGRTVWRARAIEKTLDTESKADRLWPQRMAAQGYETYFSGKWHISTDPEKCFHHVVHERPGMPGAVREGYNRPIAGRPDPWSPSDPKFGGFWQGGSATTASRSSNRLPSLTNPSSCISPSTLPTTPASRPGNMWTGTRSTASRFRRISSLNILKKKPSAPARISATKASPPSRATNTP